MSKDQKEGLSLNDNMKLILDASNIEQEIKKFKQTLVKREATMQNECVHPINISFGIRTLYGHLEKDERKAFYCCPLCGRINIYECNHYTGERKDLLYRYDSYTGNTIINPNEVIDLENVYLKKAGGDSMCWDHHVMEEINFIVRGEIFPLISKFYVNQLQNNILVDYADIKNVIMEHYQVLEKSGNVKSRRININK